MARDKLITIRIEGEKREAFNNLAKSQNTDTASLLYDFISGCLDGKIDIGIVTGRGNWIDNQIDSDRLDKLETTTQRLDERVGQISKKLNDWVEAFSDRLSDCDRELTNRMISLEHRLNTLSIQLDSQQLGSIDTDSQKDSQQENPDMGTVATVETAINTVETDDDNVETVYDTVESVYDNVESVYDNVEAVIEIVESVDEPVTGSIGPVPGETDSIEPGKGEGMNPNQAHEYLISKGIENISYYYLNKWAKEGMIPWRGKKVQKYLTLRDGLYYPIAD